MMATIDLSRSIVPRWTIWRSEAIVTPPAVSANTPSVLARSSMHSRISSSGTEPQSPAVGAQFVEHVGAVGGIANGERARDRVGTLGRDDVGARGERRRDRRTARRLSTEKYRRGAVDETEFDELLETLGDFGKLTARRDRHDDLSGRA